MPIRRYLRDWAEPEAAASRALDGSWGRVLAIPACSETDGLIRTLRHLAPECGSHTLVLVVVNGAVGAPPHFHARNATCLELLDSTLDDVQLVQGLGFRGRLGATDVLVVDRASDGRRLPEGQGVGLARKIGADVMLSLIARGAVASRWMWMTDADVEAPSGYFDAEGEAPPAGAFTVPYVHVLPSDPAQAVSAQLYDISLRYYVLGLAHAGSPYAYPTIGSTVVADADAYAKVRGFPRRNAAEDFYLLGKLAKMGGIYRASGPSLRVESRVSDRVPFGTGAAITKLRADDAARDAFSLYDPRCFTALGVWIRELDRFAEDRDLERWRERVDANSGMPGDVRRGLEASLGIPKALATAARCSPKVPVRRRHVRTWFDAFRTLKFIHGARDALWASLPWRQALAAADFVPYQSGPLGAAHEAVVATDAGFEGQWVGPDVGT